MMNLFDNLINVDVQKNMGIVGLTDEFFGAYLYNLLNKKKKSILVVVNSLFEANNCYSTVLNYTDDVGLFPMDDFLTSEALSMSPDLMINRLDTINKIISGKSLIIITNLMGYLRFLPTKEMYKKHIYKLKVGDVIEPKDLVYKLELNHYERTTIVNKTGDVGVRGFVVDVFPVGEDNPIRIEFFDDEIESIRYFDVETQKSLRKVNEVIIRPYSEFLIDKLLDDDCTQKYLPKYTKVSSINDYLDNSFVIFKDYLQLKNSYMNIMREVTEYHESRDSSFKGDYMFSLDEIRVDFPIYYMSVDNLANNKFSKVIDFKSRSINNFAENIELINSFIKKSLNDGMTVLICLKDYQLKSIAKKLTMKYCYSSLDNIKMNEVNLINKEFNNGFIYENIVLLTASSLFLVREKVKKYNTKYKYFTSISDISKLSVGDYVVHSVHGIGIYNGIKTLNSFGVLKDFLEVLYQGSDKIYVPVEKIDSLTKYSGKEGMVPKINKLGSTEWKKTKARVKEKVAYMADELLKLYAERETRKGFPFSKDNELSEAFAKNFPYELTKDQEIAIKQIKEDMEKDTPMDRLLCGDVGFGKTEVAFVAAFKAIMDSKQVIFLCPTTILSNQHYNNALVRFKDFPVTIALLNRFTPKSEVTKILDGLKTGVIDLVFGTHRLLSDDIVLKDLGLLIIDEEQRFGVKHKEKIKQYKTNVDVLTLTATPIPRTLQMSLVGIRSLSLIETPPVNRYPVQTYVIAQNDQIIRDAIYKELSRDGQVFILYNKVQSIEEEAYKISRLVPEAKIAIVHGQMTKEVLEGRIYDFINKKYDILLCTTIIETGIDIPNVNTLVIMDADHFGLSQLYQIRGRVGRSDRFAYAYLMYNDKKVLTETAVKRLNVIKEFTELGSGFAIATRDLSIRGAGEILGNEQAGFIDSVGIDLYLKMLNDEVLRRKNINVEEEEEQENKPLITVATHISDDYVDDDLLKIEIHRKINEVKSMETFLEVKKELEDRFGKLSDSLIVYMYEEWFEKLAYKLKIKNVHENRNSIELVFGEEIVKKMNVDDVFVEAFKISKMFRFLSKGTNLVIVLDTIKLDKHPVYYLVELLDKIYSKLENKLD